MEFNTGAAGMLFPLICVLIVSGNYFVDGRPQDAPQSTIAQQPSCGYESCPKGKPNMLNVHLVPHTHDDVGWLKTVDQYYFGSKNNIQQAGVQYIIDSVVQTLLLDPKKRFIYVESAFFFKWWAEQTPELQEQVKMLVNEGRLEFIGGAWSMNDEATTHYQSIIDQFTWGLRRLNDTFGECGRPRIGWQIDPFGHSREMASMFAQMGYDGLFFGRLDYQDKDERLMTRTAEMIWRASPNLGASSNLFTGALYNQYQAPPGFCFDILCFDDPIIDSPHSPDYNVKQRVDDFFDFAKRQAKYYRTKNVLITMGGDFTYQEVDEFFAFVRNMTKGYRTNHLLITMGEDFHYQSANHWYKNLDKLIKYANERQANGSDINLLYSTPSCYLKALHDTGITWPTKDDDFFPYASDPHAYWTGYFTSRPTLKRYEREGNHFLQVCKELTALAPKNYSEFTPHLTFLRETMGIMQHHDAVTGTEKQHVANSYAKRMEVAFHACGTNTRAALNLLTTGREPETIMTEKKDGKHYTKHRNYTFGFTSCPHLNISACVISEEADQFIVTLYNPLARSTYEYVRIPVPDVHYVVKDYKGVTMEIQFVPISASVQQLSFRKSDAKYELIFLASDLPALGYKSYYIKTTNDSFMKPVADPAKKSSLTTIGNEHIKLTFDTNGFLVAVMADSQSHIVNQEFLYYEGAVGNNLEFRNRSSGAYIFRPADDMIRSVTMRPKLTVYRGSLVEEVHQVFNEWISQVVRVYRQAHYAEFEWLVGPIPVEDKTGKEIISRFTSDIESEGIFYTDSNGREMIKRLRNHRDTWKLNLHEKIAGNYYPITTKIAIEDKDTRMSILTDRAQGGSSLGDGALELMVHRRLLHDDDFGVVEPLNETSYGQGLVARGTHYLVMGKSDVSHSPTTEAVERFTQLEKLLPTWKFFSDAQAVPYEEWQEKYTNIFTGISLALPKQIHLLTFEPWRDNEILIRFEHIFEKDEDPEYSKVVQFNLKDGLGSLKIVDMRETTLAANAWLGDNQRLQFAEDDLHLSYDSYAVYDKVATKVHLLKAKKPLISAKYSAEALPFEGLGADSNRLARVAQVPAKLNSERAQQLKQIPVEKLGRQGQEEDAKFIIELEPMQIRTFVVTLEKSN